MGDINKTKSENKNERIISPENNPESILTLENAKENAEEIRKEKETVLLEIEKFDMGKKGSNGDTSIIVKNEADKRKELIEAIMEEGLEELYLKMPAGKQREFKIAGEKTLIEINILLDNAKISIKKIISLIKNWLLIIPGVNKFFIEQESKIKSEEILKLKY